MRLQDLPASPTGKRFRGPIMARDLPRVTLPAIPVSHRREKLKWWLNRILWIFTLCTLTG
jgi:hypothetical protein